MTRRYVALFGVLAVAGLVSAVAGAQSAVADPPRTTWGDPDLQGTWNNGTVVPLERPDDLADTETLTDEEAAQRRQTSSDRLFSQREGDTGFYNEFWWEYGKDTNRTSLIVDPPDGKLPPLTPTSRAAQAALTAYRRQVADAPTIWSDLDTFDRCISRSLPGVMMPGFYNHNYQILQTPDYVVIQVELIHDVRIIPLDGRPHVSPKVRQWLGDSRGHWEGNTLVVETTNLNDKVKERGSTLLGTGEYLRLVERFTRVDAETIDYQFTVHDPTTYLGSWTAAIPMNQIEGSLFEYACHEGNYSMPNILRGARATEAAAAK